MSYEYIGPHGADAYKSEPTPTKKGQGLTTGELTQALRWYTDNWTDEQAAKHSKVDLSVFKVNQVYFKVKRILERGFVLPHTAQTSYERLKSTYEEQSIVKALEADAKAEAPKVDIQAATKAKALPFVEAIEVQLDKLLHVDDPKYNWFEFLKKLEIKGAYVPHIIEVIREDAAKHVEAPERFDPVIADLEKLQTAAVATRAPRKRKNLNTEKIVSKIQYLKTHAGLKVTSVNPEKIVGAQSLWVYMTERKYLTHFVADGPKGLTMSGSTVKGFNPELSLRKKLRKPEESIKVVMETSTAKAHKLIEKLTTKTKEVSGRINEETLLLRAD